MKKNYIINFIKTNQKYFSLLIIFTYIYINEFYLIKILSIKNENNNIKNIYQYYNNIENTFIYFNIIDIVFIHSIKFKLMKIEYIIKIFDKNNNLLLPSDLVLYKNIHIICNIEIINSKLILYLIFTKINFGNVQNFII